MDSVPLIFQRTEGEGINMDNKIRLDNPHKYNIGVVTPEKPYGQNVAPGAFIMVTKDELDYISATSTLLQKGRLRIHPSEVKKEMEENIGLVTEDKANFMSDEEIKKKLGMNANQLKKWLDHTEAEPDVLHRIAEIASEMNLSMNKIQVLSERIPNFDFFK